MGIFTLTLAHQFKGYGLLEKLFVFEYLNLTISLRINQTKMLNYFGSPTAMTDPLLPLDVHFCQSWDYFGLTQMECDDMRFA